MQKQVPQPRQKKYYDEDDEVYKTYESCDEDKNNRDAAFQVYGSRTLIGQSDLKQLQRGDHIGWERPYLIWHHAIVEEIDVKQKRLLVIHFTTTEGGKGEIKREWIYAEKQKGDLYRFDYPSQITKDYPPDRVIERAKRDIGKTDYNLFSNNCEHFASFCKTGFKESRQISWAKQRFGQGCSVGWSGAVDLPKRSIKPAQNTLSVSCPQIRGFKTNFVKQYLKINYDNRFDFGRQATTASQLNEIANPSNACSQMIYSPPSSNTFSRIASSPPVFNLDSIKKITEESFQSFTKYGMWGIDSLAMTGGSQMAMMNFGKYAPAPVLNNFAANSFKNNFNSYLDQVLRQRYSKPWLPKRFTENVAKNTKATGASGKNQWLGIGIAVVIETAFCGYDIFKTYRQYEAGNISNRDFKMTATRRVAEGVGSVAGGVVGGKIGNFIGGTVGSVIPVFGTALGALAGGMLGSACGKFLGSAVGSFIGKLFW